MRARLLAVLGLLAFLTAGCADDPATFTVRNTADDCGPSGQVRLDAVIFHPGPDSEFTLDGGALRSGTPAGQRDLVRPVPPTFSCDLTWTD